NAGQMPGELRKQFRDKKFLTKQVTILALSAAFIFLGANYTVESVIKISAILHVGREIVAVSAVAMGTSLPELVVTLSAAKQGNAEIAVGNVLGSNIFNSFVVMGIPGLIGRLEIPRSVVIDGAPIMLAGTILLFFATQDQKVTRWEGWLFFVFYGWFLGKTFGIV
ncbi:MAG: sodium:calcium antiporter, partial [Cyanothece sp. SIO1E1]|nr:sodium:calcium antiporter [Cyanothece sp. SIO1E1]